MKAVLILALLALMPSCQGVPTRTQTTKPDGSVVVAETIESLKLAAFERQCAATLNSEF